MAVEYRLTLAGQTPTTEVAARALPDNPDQVKPYQHLLTVDMSEHGISLTIRADRDAYLSGEGDQGLWEWEPAAYTEISGEMADDPGLRMTGTRTMFDIVARVLATGTEDAALMLNGDYLLLTRVDGVVTKHRRSVWWDHYGWPNDVIAG